ncbi:MAG: hypothetical protein M3O71_02520 [Bacteroidota bacterium]|nr:hypothetical protein [Bacteroidota bacterium]
MREAPQKTGMTVDGQRMDLENYLLNVVDRPLPKAPTHYVLAEVLNTDLSIKRVTIYFNPADTWTATSGLDNSPVGIGIAICNGLSFLGRDPNTLAYKTYIVEVASNEVVQNGFTYNCSKCRY